MLPIGGLKETVHAGVGEGWPVILLNAHYAIDFIDAVIGQRMAGDGNVLIDCLLFDMYYSKNI